MNTKRLKRKRIAMWHRDSRCFWCGTSTLLLEDTSKAARKQTRSNPLRATLDHLFSRAHPLRNITTPISCMYNYVVIACNRCNNERSRKESVLASTRMKILKNGTKPPFCTL